MTLHTILTEIARASRYAALAALVVSAPASAATYYVSGTGNDANAGTQAAPWKTIQKAADNVVPGDIVLVENGTYAGVAISFDGTAGSPITFRADGTNVVINTNNRSTPDNVNIENADFVVFEGFIIEGGSRAGIRVATSRNVILRNNYVRNCARWGIFTAFTPAIEIIGNVCSGAGEEHGIYVSNSNVAADNPILRGNECFGNAHNGIQLNGDCTAGGDGIIAGAVLEDNIIHDNGWKGFSLISVQNSVIQNNVFYNNGTSAGAGGIHLTDEPGCAKPSNANRVVNNTLVEFNIAAIRIGQGSTANVLFNNLVIASSTSNTIIDEVGSNSIDTSSNLRLTQTSGLFTDAAGNDYRLASASAALNAGRATYAGASAPTDDIEGTLRPAGSAHDIGAYEAGGSSPPPPPPPPPPSTSGIPEDHPRIMILGNRLAEYRQSACLDAAGNPIPGCTKTAQWRGLENIVVNRTDRAGPLEWALAYLVTGNPAYKTNAIADADAMVAAGWEPIVASNYRFLYVRDYLREIACTYDWLYDDLDATRRANYRNYMLMLMYISWNSDTVTHEIYDVGLWGTDKPGNNFYYNFMLATAYAGLALYGESTTQFTWAGKTYPFKLPHDGRNYTDILEFFNDMFTTEAVPDWLNTRGKGGGWHEGDQYGPSAKRHLFEALVIVKRAGGRDFFNDPITNFAAESVLYKHYSTQPGGKILYAGGDAGREPTFTLYDYDRHEMLCLADGLEGRPESGYAQYWVNRFYPLADGTQQQSVDFMFYRPTLPERDIAELPLSYRAEGLDWMNSRSGWTNDAVSVSFISTDMVAGHQHNDQNAFQIYRGSSGSGLNGWLVTDVQPFANGLRRTTNSHNTIIVDNAVCQRFGLGTGNMIRYDAVPDANPGYVYTTGDASDAYYAGLEVECYSQEGTKQLQTYQRELVHVLPGYVVVFDRVTPINPASTVRNFYHYRGQPEVTADLIESANGDGKVFQKVLLPSNAAITIVEEQIGDSKRIDTWRSEVRAVPVANHQFLTVFQISSAQTTQMADAIVVRSEQQNMVGTRIADPAHDVVLMFSTDPLGAVPGGTIEYKVGLGGPGVHYLFDLAPLMEYDVDVTVANGYSTIRVTEGPGIKTTAAGVLRFEIDAAALAAQGR